MVKRVVIAGCGIAGLETALQLYNLSKDKLEIVGVDKNRFFSFLPYLHRVAATTLREKEIIISFKDFFRKINSEFFREEIVKIEPEKKKITTSKQSIDYDYLVIALGCKTNFYGIPGAEENCFDFKDAEHAVKLSEHVAKMFFNVRNTNSKEEQEKMLRFVVCGGGATGIELVTELKYYVEYLCKKYGVEQSKVELILLEAMQRILPGLSEKIAGYAEKAIKKLGIKILCGQPVVEVGKDFVKLKNGEQIYSNTIVWCGGLQPHDVIKNSGLNVDKRGFLEVNSYLQPIFKEDVMENIYCAGDAVTFINKKTNQPLMKIGRHAVDQGKFAAKNIYGDALYGDKKKVEYVPRTEATVISLGKTDAVGFYGNRILKGRIALWIKYWIEDGYLRKYLPEIIR